MLGTVLMGKSQTSNKILIPLSPKNGFYHEGADGTVVSYLRGVLEYQTTGTGTPPFYWQYGSLRFTYQKTLPADYTNSNMQLIMSRPLGSKTINVRVTVAIQELGSMGDSVKFNLGVGDRLTDSTFVYNDTRTDQYHLLTYDTQITTSGKTFFLSATKPVFDVNPYFVFWVKIEEKD